MNAIAAVAITALAGWTLYTLAPLFNWAIPAIL